MALLSTLYFRQDAGHERRTERRELPGEGRDATPRRTADPQGRAGDWGEGVAGED